MNNFSIDRFGKLVRCELAGGVYADVSVLYLCGEV